ncbi:LytR/AlgR family response regulator transcription factor [Sphingobacterium spiritivorum]|uniref:LytR/AlgR family response regulator transcription factor n=1 Tax=Sphingobacterium spiritivorum TaxID=258 RepID=UPI00191AFE27|nr:LytTR family DNA-binding domain-containing protein [Sphingobacterium spiritivorum]QQT25521.1 response regulator transcription factor [Sphingobacterium spiritivorum]
MAIRVLIVEDESWASESLLEMLTELWNDEYTAVVKSTVRDVISWLSKNETDLIFMDIHLGDGLSFDIFNHIKIQTPVIFTTAFDEYALEAFRNQGYAYLLKPFELPELKEALSKVESLLPREEIIPHYKNRFLVRYGIRLKSVPVEDIAYFMADDKLLYGFSVQGDRFIVDDALSKLAPRLDPEFFFQINRKFIIHIQSIGEMLKMSRNRIKLQLHPQILENLEIIVSEEKSHDFQLWLDK